MLKKLIIATVRFSAGHPWPVLLAAIVLSPGTPPRTGGCFSCIEAGIGYPPGDL